VGKLRKSGNVVDCFAVSLNVERHTDWDEWLQKTFRPGACNKRCGAQRQISDPKSHESTLLELMKLFLGTQRLSIVRQLQ